MNEEYIKNILHDFEHCGENGGCGACKANDIINSTNFRFCELLLAYRSDIENAIIERLDTM